MTKEYIKLGDLIVYRQSLEVSCLCWKIFERFTWQDKKIMGDQFIRSIDSIGANIAEGYGRYHYLDKIKFYYNSRGSLLEAKHWALLLYQRSKISQDEFKNIIKKLNNLHQQLNLFIRSNYQTKYN